MKLINDKYTTGSDSKNHKEVSLPQNDKELRKIFNKENNEWKKTLGADVEIKSIPDYITPEILFNLKKMGMELRYIPNLDINNLEILEQESVFQYLKKLQNKYPKWHNLDSNYWNMVSQKTIQFPKLPGQWIAVETFHQPKDEYYSGYEINKIIGITQRRNNTWEEIDKSIKLNQNIILKAAGLSSGIVRLPEPIEWNLLDNREKWNKIKYVIGPSYYKGCEYTNTRSSNKAIYLEDYSNHYGSTSCKEIPIDKKSFEDIIFRIAIILPDSLTA
jgi:hypothetical protein